MGPEERAFVAFSVFTSSLHHVYDRLYISIPVFMASLGVKLPRVSAQLVKRMCRGVDNGIDNNSSKHTPTAAIF